MKILNLCSYYCGSKVHSNLYKELDELGVEQTIYVSCRVGVKAGLNSFESPRANFIYKSVLSAKHRIFYHIKIRLLYRCLRESIKPGEYDLAQAVNLFTDGALAYKLYRDNGVPYVVTVRNTDINEFLAIAPHTWPMAIRVLKNARKIVFISEAPKEKFCRHFLIKQLLPEIEGKFMVQPNGIDDFWLDNVWRGERNLSHNIIYVGKFDVNKNVVRLIKAVLKLQKQIPDVHLHLVGGDGWREKDVLKLVEQNPNCLTYHGKIFDKDKLKALYRECGIFAMPSIHETFGLVYIEALSQGLPVIYSKYQGIDGLFSSNIGESVNAFYIDSIKTGLMKILQNPDDYSNKGLDFEMFRWGKISERYKVIYSEILRSIK